MYQSFCPGLASLVFKNSSSVSTNKYMPKLYLKRLKIIKKIINNIHCITDFKSKKYLTHVPYI